jgi:hypothetical protein
MFGHAVVHFRESQWPGASLILPVGGFTRLRTKRIRRIRASQPRLAEKRIHRVRAGMRGRSPQSRKWQMGKTPRNRRRKALKKLALTRVEVTQFFGERAIGFFSRNLFERTPQVRQASAYGPRCQFAAQTSEPLVNSCPHWRKPHELSKAPLLRSLYEVVHSNTSDSSYPSGLGISVGRNPKIDEKRCPGTRRLGNVRQCHAIEHRFTATRCQNESAELRWALTEPIQRHGPTPNSLGKFFRRLERAIDHEKRYPGAVQDHPAAPGHR